MPDFDHYLNTVTCGDCLELMKELPDECVDLVVTDPPYGIGFMGKNWDRALPSVEVWQECLRVLKPGAFAFVMCIPRADCLSRMIIGLEDAGFNVGFTPIYWAFASGFPKAQNIGKAVDKRLGVERKVIGIKSGERYKYAFEHRFDTHNNYSTLGTGDAARLTESASPEAKALDGSFGGFQPKPAVEVILVAMKPLSEKTFVDQALQNGKGVTWLDDARIPYDETGKPSDQWYSKKDGAFPVMKQNQQWQDNPIGRFPANLICSDDALNDGRTIKGSGAKIRRNNDMSAMPMDMNKRKPRPDFSSIGDSGSFSRYFSLDSWFTERIKQLPESVQKTFPFLIVSKASKSEKNRGCEEFIPMAKCELDKMGGSKCGMKTGSGNERNVFYKNNHPTVKPIKLFSYLITLGSRQDDVVLDPYLGSGTTKLAAQILNRQWIGFEINPEYCAMAEARITNERTQLKLEMSLCQR